MRNVPIALIAVVAIGAGETAWAQQLQQLDISQSLCNPCVDPPVRQILRRDGYAAPGAVTVITAEDMRELGIISVADMIRLLPSQAAAEEASLEPVPTEAASTDVEVPDAAAPDAALEPSASAPAQVAE